jgi:hypothetical protein
MVAAEGIPDHRSVHHFLDNFPQYVGTVDLVIRFLQVRTLHHNRYL